MYWFIILNGKKLPTPYATIEELDAAEEELQERLGPCHLSSVYE